MDRSQRHRVFAHSLALLSAILLAGAAPLRAEPGAVDLLSPETLKAVADIRLVLADGERGWQEGGFGKLRYGGNDPAGRSDLTIEPKFAEADLVWQPRFAWSLTGTVVGMVQDGDRLRAGLSEAFLSWKPLSGGPVRVSARAGLMWPPISLEHSGPEWTVTDSISPSAINSWVGEEVKVVGAELGLSTRLGAQKIAVTGAIFDANDTAGSLLAFRGWAIHDQKVMPSNAQPLPPLSAAMAMVQPSYSHPLIEMDGGFFNRPGYYTKLAWDLPVPLRLELHHYDNGGDPEAVNDELEWGWRTRFDNVGLVTQAAENLQIRAQAMRGSAKMGYFKNGVIWVDTRFRSAYAMVTRSFDRGAVSGRIEAFDTRNHGSKLTTADDEHGWSVMVAGRRSFGPNLTGLVEALHVESSRDARQRAGLAPRQPGSQLQLSLRASW